ncbi:MAG: S24 family peptidase [Proteobacteria bacterium]|nr:MAG: S24 family peptidase [Pseudomonadota bacterium]
MVDIDLPPKSGSIPVIFSSESQPTRYDMSACAESEPFALQVLGDSMEPEFPNGVIVIIEPTGAVEDGTFVVAFHEDGVILRRLRSVEDDWRLEALNPAYPEIPISGMEQIRGRVVQRAGRRRKERKSYV